MSQEEPTIAPRDFIKQLRGCAPPRPLSLGESYTVAERQAGLALQLLGIAEAGASLAWLVDLPRVEVQLIPRHRMEGLSGMTTFSHGRYLVLVNRNDSHARRRFTLAHELKHVLDYPAAATLHAQLGSGSPERQQRQIEQVADHFAACLLMPKMLVRRAWTAGLQDLVALAGMFGVSVEAMRVRLSFLGYLYDQPRDVRTYFRHASIVLPAA